MTIGTMHASASARRSAGALVRPAAFLLALGVAWLVLAPVQLGGKASYVVTDGTSMLPTFRADGLVITRARDDYGVGDVVAYQNRELKNVVMHRIVAVAGNRFVLQGDNNDFLDTFEPQAEDIVGEEWVYWPRAGRYLEFLRDPVMFAVLVGLSAVAGFRVPPTRRRRRRHHAT